MQRKYEKAEKLSILAFSVGVKRRG